ncbi:MAG: hypothetical protein COW55_01410 [Rhodobacteraceae bacterium CG17_big_fil_post_rev_8_21_14_2_50_65_11]|nr:MAG: hypothetical protein COW55_01410 [Rhodobacteraceae bacterium CG17_big_fil_post_rev_8_21_14_2_50_65_11]
MTLRAFLAGLGLSALASVVQAEGWSVSDLGSLDTREDCMRLADATIDSYRATYGGNGFTGRSEWTVGGYDLRGDVVDALIICPIKAGLAAPFLIVFNSDGDNDARGLVAGRLEDIWDRLVAADGSALRETK